MSLSSSCSGILAGLIYYKSCVCSPSFGSSCVQMLLCAANTLMMQMSTTSGSFEKVYFNGIEFTKYLGKMVNKTQSSVYLFPSCPERTSPPHTTMPYFSHMAYK